MGLKAEHEAMSEAEGGSTPGKNRKKAPACLAHMSVSLGRSHVAGNDNCTIRRYHALRILLSFLSMAQAD